MEAGDAGLEGVSREVTSDTDDRGERDSEGERSSDVLSFREAQ